MKAPIIVIALLTMLSLNSCAENGSTGPNASPAASDMDVNAMLEQIAVLPSGTLTSALADGLVHMREEEKLAHDVYQYLGQKYGTTIFQNIAASETRHMAAIKGLLDKYGIADPVVSDVQGAFTDPAFTALYQSLTQQGETGPLQAYVVGATIEDLDIKDLMDLTASGLPADINFVYGNLTRASENHIRAFSAQIRTNGGTYVPQYITQALYDTILSTRNGRGRR